jgi:phosphate/sulfate permease
MLISISFWQIVVFVSSVIVGTQTITAAINGVFNVDSKFWRHLISWIVAVLVGLGFVLTGGVSFGLPEVWQEYLVGGLAGLIAGGAANGFYDWDKIKEIFHVIENVFRAKPEMLND